MEHVVIFVCVQMQLAVASNAVNLQRDFCKITFNMEH